MKKNKEEEIKEKIRINKKQNNKNIFSRFFSFFNLKKQETFFYKIQKIKDYIFKLNLENGNLKIYLFHVIDNKKYEKNLLDINVKELFYQANCFSKEFNKSQEAKILYIVSIIFNFNINEIKENLIFQIKEMDNKKHQNLFIRYFLEFVCDVSRNNLEKWNNLTLEDKKQIIIFIKENYKNENINKKTNFIFQKISFLNENYFYQWHLLNFENKKKIIYLFFYKDNFNFLKKTNEVMSLFFETLKSNDQIYKLLKDKEKEMLIAILKDFYKNDFLEINVFLNSFFEILEKNKNKWIKLEQEQKSIIIYNYFYFYRYGTINHSEDFLKAIFLLIKNNINIEIEDIKNTNLFFKNLCLKLVFKYKEIYDIKKEKTGDDLKFALYYLIKLNEDMFYENHELIFKNLDAKYFASLISKTAIHFPKLMIKIYENLYEKL